MIRCTFLPFAISKTGGNKLVFGMCKVVTVQRQTLHSVKLELRNRESCVDRWRLLKIFSFQSARVSDEQKCDKIDGVCRPCRRYLDTT